MNYEVIRQFADSYALGAMVIVYLVLVLWAFRPGSRRHNHSAANMIFAEDHEVISDEGSKHHG